MRRLLAAVVLLLGLVLAGAALFNGLNGLYVAGDGSSHKWVLSEWVGGSCDAASIDAGFAEDPPGHPCVAPAGLLEGADIGLAGLGVALIIVGRVLRPSGNKAAKVMAKRRRAKVTLGLGAALIIIGGADWGGLLNDGDQLDWASLVGDAVAPLIMDVVLIVLGLLLILRARRTLDRTDRDAQAIGMGLVDGPDAEGQRKAYRGKGSKAFKGPLETKGADRFGTVGDLRRSMQLDQYEDAFQQGTSDGEDEAHAGRPCHYCSGVGCSQCNNTGYL